MIAGSDKGTVGTIVALNTKHGMVTVEGVNIKVGGCSRGARHVATGMALWCSRAQCVQAAAGGRTQDERLQPQQRVKGPVGFSPPVVHKRGALAGASHLAPSHLCTPPCLSHLQTKHVKPTAAGEEGQILKKEFPVHHSNVAVYSTAQQTHSRVGFK